MQYPCVSFIHSEHSLNDSYNLDDNVDEVDDNVDDIVDNVDEVDDNVDVVDDNVDDIVDNVDEVDDNVDVVDDNVDDIDDNVDEVDDNVDEVEVDDNVDETELLEHLLKSFKDSNNSLWHTAWQADLYILPFIHVCQLGLRSGLQYFNIQNVAVVCSPFVYKFTK